MGLPLSWQIVFNALLWLGDAGTDCSSYMCIFLSVILFLCQQNQDGTKREGTISFVSMCEMHHRNCCGRIYRHELVDGEVREAFFFFSDANCIVIFLWIFGVSKRKLFLVGIPIWQNCLPEFRNWRFLAVPLMIVLKKDL